MEAGRKQQKLFQHQRQRSQCKDYGGSAFCEHQRIQSQSKDCGRAGGGGFCEPQRRRSQCKDCGGSAILDPSCKECGVRRSELQAWTRFERVCGPTPDLPTERTGSSPGVLAPEPHGAPRWHKH